MCYTLKHQNLNNNVICGYKSVTEAISNAKETVYIKFQNIYCMLYIKIVLVWVVE